MISIDSVSNFPMFSAFFLFFFFFKVSGMELKWYRDEYGAKIFRD